MEFILITSPFLAIIILSSAIPNSLANFAFWILCLFSPWIGIKYFGLNEYPDKSDFDGHWGIYDEPYLLYCANKLNEFKKPFIATIFTLSSHQPYPVPEKYKNRFNKGTHQIHNSVAYTDNALLEFFSTMKKMDWYNNTLFFITADHVHSYVEKNKNDFVDFYRKNL